MPRVIDLRKKEPTEKASPAPEHDPVPATIPPPETETVSIQGYPAKKEVAWETVFFNKPDKAWVSVAVIALFSTASLLYIYANDVILEILFVLSAFVLILHANKKPDLVSIRVSEQGFSIGEKTFNYRELKSFWIDYNPHGTKEISLQPAKRYLPYIKVSLGEQDPLIIREIMINFIPEKVHASSLADIVGKKLGF